MNSIKFYSSYNYNFSCHRRMRKNKYISVEEGSSTSWQLRNPQARCRLLICSICQIHLIRIAICNHVSMVWTHIRQTWQNGYNHHIVMAKIGRFVFVYLDCFKFEKTFDPIRVDDVHEIVFRTSVRLFPLKLSLSILLMLKITKFCTLSISIIVHCW